MIYRIAADIIVVIHFAFILFVVAGAFWVLKKPKLAWIHVPAALWGAWVEFMQWICPLTPLENYFRSMGGAERYPSDFVENYIIPIMYPQGLTVSVQIVLGILVVLVNTLLYSIIIYKYNFKKR